MGGSILPVTIHNNTVCFLFGKERDIDENPGWSDFGGGSDKGETLMNTATREGSEELTGFLGSKTDIHRLLKKYGTYPIDYKTKGYPGYRCHIFPMKYDALLPFYYNNNQRFIQKQLDPKIIRDTKIFEKTEIQWFSFADIQKKRNQFRSFYKKIIDLILANRKGIEAFVRKKLARSKNTLKNSHSTTTYKRSKKTYKRR